MTEQDLQQCRQAGRKAFQIHGVTGASCHSYPAHSMQRQAFVDGHDQARTEAADRALHDAAAYHALTVREASKDRAWAEKLAQG